MKDFKTLREEALRQQQRQQEVFKKVIPSCRPAQETKDTFIELVATMQL